MALEDFTTYTEVDPNSHIGLVGTDHIDFAAYRNEDAYLYKDYGVGHFGNFTHKIDVKLLDEVNSTLGFFWVLANSINDVKGIEDASQTAIGLYAYGGSSSTNDYPRFTVRESYGGSGYQDVGATNLSTGTWYYLLIKKTGTAFVVGVYSTAALRDAGDGTDGDVDNLALTLQANHTLRYAYAANTWNSGNGAYLINLDIEDLDLQGGQTHEASATLAGTGTLTAAATVIEGAVYGEATLSGTGSLAALGSYLRLATAALTGTGSLSAQGGVSKLGAASLSGVGNLTASAVVILAAKATLAGTGTLAAAAGCIRLAAATLQGTGSLAAAGALTSLTATLLAAQKKAHRLPYVEAKVYDYEQGIKRLSWTRLYEGSEPDNHHGVAFDGQGSMHRIRAAASNTLYRQKVTNPGPSSDYSQWTQIATDCYGPCAIAAYGAKVYIFYRTTGNVLWKHYSHDYGQTWNNAQLVSYADVLSMAACWWGTGDIVVCFALKSNELNGIVLDTSDQTTSQHIKEFHGAATHIFLDTYGIGATFNASWPCCEIVLAAKESDTPYNHYDLFRTWFSDTYNFLALESFLMSPDGENITYEYPDCHLPASAQSYETNRIVAVEKYAGTTAYTRPLACHMVKGTYWSDTTFTEPKPFLDISSNYGLRLQSTADYWWMEKPDGVWRAPRPADSPLDLTKDIVALSLQNVIASPTLGGRGNLVLELDNSKGQYASPGSGALASLRFRSEIVLKLGYKTPEGNLALEAGTYWIDSWQYQSVSLRGESRSNLSTFTLFCLDGWGLMDRWIARYQMRWNKDAVNPKSVWQILYQLLARAGIKLTNTPAKPQSSAINNFYPDFTVNPGTQGDSAIRRLLSFVPDRLVFRGQEAFTKNPLASESSCYSYGTDHAILSGKYTDVVTVSRARTIGRDSGDNRILEEAQDWDLLQLAIDILEQDYDPNLQTAARAQERADAILRTQQTQSTPATIVVPTNVGQELLDVVEVTDERCGVSAEKYRVQAIQTDYDRRQGIYTQRLALCAP